MTYSSMTTSPAVCIPTAPSPPETIYSSILVTNHIFHPRQLRAHPVLDRGSTKLGFIIGVEFYYLWLIQNSKEGREKDTDVKKGLSIVGI